MTKKYPFKKGRSNRTFTSDNKSFVRAVLKENKTKIVRTSGGVVIAPSLEGIDTEYTVIFKRKAEYKKPSFA